MKWNVLLPLSVLIVLGLMATPASAQPTGLCSSTCTASSSCDMDCYDTGGSQFYSTCGDYGVCSGICQGPTTWTYEETVLTGSTVSSVSCHFDHWFYGDPYASPKYYQYTTFFYRIDTIRVTVQCDGTRTEQVISSRTSSGYCAQRTWSTCYSAYSYPGLTCA